MAHPSSLRPHHIACAVVGDYLPHAAAMLASLGTNGGIPGAVVHLFHDGSLDTDALDAVGHMCGRFGMTLEDQIVRDEQLADVPVVGFTGKGSWYRVLLPELLPAVDRVLYLDADLLVTGPLGDLVTTDLGGDLLGAVANVFPTDQSRRLRALGLRTPDQYFNAGVLLLDLAGMRAAGVTEQLLRYGSDRSDELILRDQDACNVVLQGRWSALHPRWNCMNSLFDLPGAAVVFPPPALKDAMADPAIRHFEGPMYAKPWHAMAHRPSRRLYRKYRAMTPWPRVTWDDRTAATTVLGLLPVSVGWRLYRRLRRYRP